MRNIDAATVEGFGREWKRFDYAARQGELRGAFEAYFRLFPWSRLPEGAVGFDFGCGSGRWAAFVSERPVILHCVDASPAALEVARNSLSERSNCVFHVATAEEMPMPPQSMDFGYSLGVLHHIPDARSALRSCVEKLKPGAPFLLYMYYAFDNRPWWYRALWRTTDFIRRVVSRLPFVVRSAISQVIAVLVYWPLARAAAAAERLGASVDKFPLSFYRSHTLYVMRNDALDRFGTRLEHRFTQTEIRELMTGSGLTAVSFSAEGPFWTALGFRR